MQKMRVPFLGLFFVLVGDNVVAVLLDVVLVVVVGVVAENVKKNRERGKDFHFSKDESKKGVKFILRN